MASTTERRRPTNTPSTTQTGQHTRLLLLVGAAIELVLVLGLVRPLWLWSHHAAIPTYEPLATVFGATWAGAGRFAAVLLLWLAGYGVALRIGRQPLEPTARRALIGFPVLFATTLLLVLPVSSQDVYHYLMEGRVLAVHGANPMVTPPSAFPNDPLGWTISAWSDQPAPYGPVFALLAAGVAALAGESLVVGVLGFKLLMTAALFGTAVLAAAALRRSHPHRALAAYVFIAWNPLALYEAAVNAHNTWLMAFFLALALWLIQSRGSTLALPALALGALTKYVVGLAGPALLLGGSHFTRQRPPHPGEDRQEVMGSGRFGGQHPEGRLPVRPAREGKMIATPRPVKLSRRPPRTGPHRPGEMSDVRLAVKPSPPPPGWRGLVSEASGWGPAIALSAVLAILLYAPFWAGARTFGGAGTAADFILSSPGWLLRQALKHALGWELAGSITVVVCTVVFLVGWAILLARQWQEMRWPAATAQEATGRVPRWVFAVLLWQLLTLSWALWPWYPLVLLPPAALLTGWQPRLTVTITAAGLLAYVPINFAPAFWGAVPSDRMPLAVVLVMVGGPAMFMAAWAVLARWRGGEIVR